MGKAKPVSKHACADCGKPNAVGRDRFCWTCKKRHRKESAAKAHEKSVIAKYGIAQGEYALLLAFQGGRCAICRGKGSGKRLALDHDHESGKPRGLLCRRCNYVYLGQMLGDSLETLKIYYDNTNLYLTDPPYGRMLREQN